MNQIDLIGRVATEFLRRSVLSDNADHSDGVSRFLLDRLTGEQVACICNTLLADPFLNTIVDIKVPRKLVDGYVLPSGVLTDERTTFWRNAPCDKEAIILANTSDDQGQSLRDITAIGARDLKGVPDLWVSVASKDLPLTDDQKKIWEKALRGLQEANDCSLEQFSTYVLKVHEIITSEGIPVVRALGWALPSLRIPRDSTFFESIPEKYLGQVSKWRQMFASAYSKRGCYLSKQNPNRQTINNDDIWNLYKNVKDQISPDYYEVVEKFICCKETWSNAIDRFAELEWESDNIGLIFSGLRIAKLDLPSKTIQFYNDEFPDSLSKDDFEYLDALRKRKGARDEDKDFYENHRHELEMDRALKSQWEKFVYGKPIECSDFLVGLVMALQRLFAQCDYTSGYKELKIRTSKGKGQKQWLDINEDVGLYFCVAYRGIEKLTSNSVVWDTNWLFKYDQLIAQRRQRKDYKKNTSTGKSATKIAFNIELVYTDLQGSNRKNIVSLVWNYQATAIGLELYDDLGRLSSHPFSYSSVGKNPISKKGKLQNILLNDVGTLRAVYGQDRGSLVSTHKRSINLSKLFLTELKKGLDDERLSSEQYVALKGKWENFAELYSKAILEWKDEGLSSELLITQVTSYEALLDELRTSALRDTNRIHLWHPVIKLGNIQVEGNKPASIIVPWHPLRMAEKGVKIRQVISLINYVLRSEDVDFGDPQLFFNDLCLELSQPYYPEVAIGFQGDQAHILSVTDTVNDYSLMESPVRGFDDSETNEDPREATEKVLAVVNKYIDLQPHEKANLSIALFNCDSTRLPQSIVSGISVLNDHEEEVRCQVVLRHRDLIKLSDLYMKMIESADQDPDLMVASEVSKDFMARLRIGVMADAAPISNTVDGKPVDIVFLQDVISREAKLVWVEAQPTVIPGLLEHVPPRWGKRKSAAKDELKSTSYLVSPSQASSGWSYLRTVHAVAEGTESREDVYLLPARQISFQNEKTKGLFEEAHTLGEWVINCDSLLEPRLLKSQGVQVIKYQHGRAQGPSMVVSSKSQLNMLKVLVKRRLQALNLSLSDEELSRITEAFIEDANNVSGDIVLRAAKRGVFASELLGVVLSKMLITSDVFTGSPISWFFLDDYASWLGQKEEQIADILALSPQIIDGKPCLTVIISEAKYVDAKRAAEAKRNSQKQLRDTVSRMNNAIFGNPGRLDRDLWLSRLSELVNESTEIPLDSILTIEEWREGIRSGTISIELKGYSHVFVSSQDSHVESERFQLSNVERCFQEVYARDKVRELVLAYVKRETVLPVREQIGDERPWLSVSMQLPAPRVNLIGDNTDSKYQDIGSGAAEEINEINENQSGALSPFHGDESYLRSNYGEPTSEGSKLSSESGLTNEQQNARIESNQDNHKTNTVAESWANEIVNTLRAALISYGLQAKVLDKRLTPNAVLVRLKGSDQLKIDDIEKKRSQLLTTHAIDVINIMAQPGEIVVSIARSKRETITLSEVWRRRILPESNKGMNMSFIVGIKEIDGEILYLNLGGPFAGLEQHAPHTLIAGATGSGKSVLLQNLILDICATNSIELAKIYLIDPKFGVDYQHLEELPHLCGGIIIEQDKAVGTLEHLVQEMDRRYMMFRVQKVNNLRDYNAKVQDQEKLPLLFLIHDEFAEWMLVDTYKQAISASVQRLGVKARAAGIHLIFAAQRPDTNVLPVQLRDNLGNRLILRVESVGTSEISLGEKGAERLLGKGHLVARLQGEPNLIYAQVPFLTNEDLSEAARLISKKH